MKQLLFSILLIPFSGFSQSLHQLTPEEVILLNISKITADQEGFRATFNFNGAGFVARPNIVSGLIYSPEKTDTTYTPSGKIKTLETDLTGLVVKYNYYYSDTLVDSTRIELLKFIDHYRNGVLVQKIPLEYEYNLRPIRETYNKLIGSWTVCHSFAPEFRSYNRDIDSLLFIRGKEACSWKKGKYSNAHILHLKDNDSFAYKPQLKGKKRKVGIEYFNPCWMWTYDCYGFDIGYIKGLSALNGKIRFVDDNHFWLIFE